MIWIYLSSITLAQLGFVKSSPIDLSIPEKIKEQESNSFFIEKPPLKNLKKPPKKDKKSKNKSVEFNKENLKRWENTTFLQLAYGDIGQASYHFNKWNTSYIDYSKSKSYSLNTWNWALDNGEPYPNKIPFEKVNIKNSPNNDTHSIFAAINFRKSCNSSVDNGVFFRYLHLTLVYNCFITGYLEDFDQDHNKITYDFEGDYLYGFNMRNQLHYVRDICWPVEQIGLAAELGLGKYVYGNNKL